MGNNHIHKLVVLVLGLSMMAACSKMDHTYKPIIKNGEVIYTGKADSVRGYPGKERIRLSWLLISDPKISFCKVFWNNGKDSVTIPVNRTDGIDTIRTLIDHLKEGTYTFKIYSGDEQGHQSVASSISVNAYGAQYQATLYERPYDDVRWTDGMTTILWEHAAGGLTGSELTYTNTSGDDVQLYIPAGADTTRIDDLKEGSRIKYRTLFMPDSNAVDTFYTDDAFIDPVFETEMDKSLFQQRILPGDALAAYGWVMSRLWDGSAHEPQGFFCTGPAFPFQYSFDLGQVAQLSRYKVWQRGVIESPGYLYAGDNASKWTIWGAVDPATDGSWDGWTKLMDCQSIKPSGLAVGSVSDADKAYAAAGEQFVFPDSIPPVRYIRIQVQATWGKGKPQVNSMEMTFWKKNN